MTPEEIEDLKKMWEHAETIYISKEAYDHLIEELNKPPQYNEKIAKLLQRKAPWDEHNN